MKRPMYTDREALNRNIDKCTNTIKTFQTAIEKEHETIFELKGYLKELDAYDRWKAENGGKDAEESHDIQVIVE